MTTKPDRDDLFFRCLRQAIDFVSEGDLERATVFLTIAMAERPDAFAPYVQLVKVHLLRDEPTEAAALLERAPARRHAQSLLRELNEARAKGKQELRAFARRVGTRRHRVVAVMPTATFEDAPQMVEPKTLRWIKSRSYRIDVYRAHELVAAMDIIDELVIGSAETAHLKLRDDAIAPRHAELSLSAEQQLVGLAILAPGLYFNGRPSSGFRTLYDGDGFTIGDFRFEVRVRAAAPVEEECARRRVVITRTITVGEQLGSESGVRPLADSRAHQEVLLRQVRDAVRDYDGQLSVFAEAVQEAKVDWCFALPLSKALCALLPTEPESSKRQRRALAADVLYEAAVQAHAVSKSKEALQMLVAAVEQAPQHTHAFPMLKRLSMLLSAPEIASAYDDPLLGSVVDDGYQLERVLGVGGYCKVYRARSIAIGRRSHVAIKMLSPQLSRDAVQSQRFKDEATRMAAIGSEYVVDVEHVGSFQGQLYMILELLDGTSLAQHLVSRGALSVAQCLDIGLAVAQGLAAAHDHGVIHRDLKPSNIMLCASGVVPAKLIDFGISRKFGVDDQERKTMVGEILGTPAYMSPERFFESIREVDAKCDVYALGVVLYEMLEGKLPFIATGDAAQATREYERLHRLEKPPEITAAAPAQLKKLIAKCMAKKTSQRPSIAEVVASLRALRAPRRKLFG